jgi:hypothetical protein
MEMLPADYRDAVVLHHLEGCTIQQVADVMGSSIGTTAARLSRARAMMRERLSWRGVVMSDAAIAALFVEEVVRDGVSDATATRAAMRALTAETAIEGVAVASIAMPHVAIARTTAAAAKAAHGGIALYAGLSATQWIAAACVSTIFAVGGAVITNADWHPKTRVRVSESASMSRSTRSAGENEPSSVGSASHTTRGTNVPEPASLGVLAIAAAALPLRRRSRDQRR